MDILMLRLFLGFRLDYAVRRNLELMLEHFAPLAELHWTKPDNFHITTTFLGSWPEDRLPELKAALAAAPLPPAFQVNIDGLGWFDNPHNPRSLFAGVRAPAALAEVKQITEAALAPLGWQREARPYVPHVTLARVKTKPDLGPLRRAIASLPSNEFGECHLNRHLLYRSDLNPSGSTYTVVGEFPLR
ncbi:MAG: RNA 2',3'-cyclic phosphodiesterase [Bryobacter sp.]|nr:RNA 2',3'-cyclic phosphodiesterase [Bryobacter sp.]